MPLLAKYFAFSLFINLFPYIFLNLCVKGIYKTNLRCNLSIYKEALQNQISAVYALIMREILTRYGDRKLGFLWVVFEALAHIIVFAAIKYFLQISGPDGTNVILFLVTGIIPFFYFRNVISRLTSALSSNKALLTLPQISFLDFYYARFILESATALITLVTTLFVAIIFISNSEFYYFTGFEINNFLQIIQGIALLGLLGFGVGLIISAVGSVFESITMIASVWIRMLYFISGVIFSIDIIPYQYHKYLYWNPILHCMEIIRTGFFYEYTPNEQFMDAGYVVFVGLFLTFIGLLLVLKMKSWTLR